MGVFKNDVGRPTNETIKKRRILKVILALLVAGALFTGGYYVNEFINKYDVNKEEKENSINSKIILKETLDEDANAEFTYNNKIYNLSIKTEEEKVSVFLNKKSIYEVFAPVGLGNIYLLDDLLVIHIYSGDVRGQGLVFIDFEGNVVKEIGNVIEGNLVLNIGTRDDNISIKNDTITLNMTARTHGETLVYKDNNDIEGSMPYSETVKSKYNINDDTIIDATYEFKYLGNKKFSEMKIVDKITYKEYVESQGLVYEELDINSEEVTNLFNVYNKFNTDRTLSFIYTPGFTYFYNQDKVYMKDIDESLKFAIIYDEYFENKFKEDYAYAEHKIYLTDLNKISNKLFSTSLDIKKVIDKDNYINVFGCSQLKYNEKDQSIVVTQDGCGDCALAKFDTKIMSAVKSENKIEIVNKVMFLYESGCDPEELKIFKTATNDYNNKSGFKNEIADLTNKNISLEDVKIDDYLDKLDSFKWTFIKNNEGNYIFESVEKIKGE